MASISITAKDYTDDLDRDAIRFSLDAYNEGEADTLADRLRMDIDFRVDSDLLNQLSNSKLVKEIVVGGGYTMAEAQTLKTLLGKGRAYLVAARLAEISE